MKPLKICLDARLISGTAGGVEQFVIGLAHGLSQLTDGQEEYYFLAYSDADEWIKPYISGPCRILHCSKAPRSSRLKTLLKINAPKLYDLLQKLYPVSERWKISNLWSDGTIEKAKIDIMHFTHQVAFLTKVPSIYHPHDLQHIHLPHYFSMSKRVLRELLYRIFSSRAKLVAVSSSWVKADLIRNYNLSNEKVQVIPLAPVINAFQEPTHDDFTSVQQKFSLPDSFIFYPAQTWPHKNHLGLLDAVAILREQYGMVVSVVFAGSISGTFFLEIKRHIELLRLDAQSCFLGFVTSFELQCLYKLAKCVVIPTKYEAGSFPIWEAFLSGVPVACSNVTSLPTQAGDAALIFNHEQPEEIAEAIRRLWTDESLRQTLIERGHKNVNRYLWERTVRIFRAHYRRIAKHPLTEEDQKLLIAPPLM
ncbi:glycosyltransferase family 4 protein [Desulfobacter vibrioformis]|uniref:glycosyltransferase family 4 protein n=1 Tax=Desulfobacter vibrioformis TaxID=34031 RepID=UPI00054DD0E6|nr:glycosyltransferase family 1 protein [Desulfobacter vibrioformis]